MAGCGNLWRIINMKLMTVGILFSLTTSAALADWLQWRGPSFSGSATVDAKPPVSWGETENVAWKLPIPGRGSGTPVVAGNDLYVVTSIDTGKTPDGAAAKKGDGRDAPEALHQFVVICVDRSSGKVRWKKTVAEMVPHSGHHRDHFYASASPVTDGKHVWAHFGSRGTYCLTKDGELVWSRQDLGKMTTRGGFGDGSSPALFQNCLIIPWDHEGDSFVTALDARTGKTLWKTDRPDTMSSWSTPLVTKVGNQDLVILNGHPTARAYDVKTGKEVWRADGPTQRPVATPIVTQGLALICSGFRGNFFGAYKLEGASGDLSGSKHELWTHEKNCPDIASPAVSGNRVYFHSGKDAILSCHDIHTGKAHYMRKRMPGLRKVYASPVIANGHVYVTGRSGKVVVIKDADKFEVVSTNDIGEGVDASPVVIGDTIYLRATEHLYCIKASK